MLRLASPRVSKPLVFSLLMCFSGLLLILPPAWSGWMRGIIQPITWLEWPIVAAGRTLRAAAGPTASDAAKLKEQNERLERLAGHQSLALLEKDKTIAELAGLREHLGPGRTRVIIAAVVAGPASARREWITISAGSLQGVQLGNWVAAAAPSSARPPKASGRDLLSEQWLIGQVSQVSPHVSTVRLSTDPEFGPVRVRPTKPLDDGRWQPTDHDELLYGAGGGTMRMRAAESDYFAAGFRAVVVPLAGVTELALTVGQITAARPAAESALHFDLTVTPYGSVRELAQVYVLVPPE